MPFTNKIMRVNKLKAVGVVCAVVASAAADAAASAAVTDVNDDGNAISFLFSRMVIVFTYLCALFDFVNYAKHRKWNIWFSSTSQPIYLYMYKSLLDRFALSRTNQKKLK